MVNLTPAVKRSITQDWQMLVPQFAIYKPLWLARRVGPLVHGLCLDKDSGNDSYLPLLHIHSLCRPFPCVTLTLAQPLLSVRSSYPEHVSVRFHETKYRLACERLLSSSLLPMNGDWTVAQLLESQDIWRDSGRGDYRFPVTLMEDAVSVLAWLGENKQAETLAERYTDEVTEWPEYVLEQIGGLLPWGNSLHKLASSTEMLRHTVEEQINMLGLEQMPVSRLLH
jgi:hypothetical protein